MAAGLTASLLITGTFVILGAAPSYAVPPTTTVATPIPGLSAVCTPPPASKSVGQGGPAPVGFGVTATGAGGVCTSSVTGFMAKASVGRTTFGANTVLSATAMCQDANTPSGQPVTVTSSAFYNGATITATTTIHTVDGYTLNFNVRTPNGAIALQIITPGGDVVNIAQVSCGGAAYPLNASLNTDQRVLSPVVSGGHSGGPVSPFMLLLAALAAFLAVNFTVVRRYRHRHNGTAG